MNIEDEEFNEEYKPLYIPNEYKLDSTWQDKAIYALAVIGKGSAADVAGKMAELEDSDKAMPMEEHAEEVLNNLYEKGLLKGLMDGQIMIYNLSKMEKAHDGRINPEQLR